METSTRGYIKRGDFMDYVKMLEKENVGLKETLKKIFKDIDERLQETKTSEDAETGGT